MQRVHHVAREDAVAAHRPDPARAMDRQDRADEVEPELAVQVIRPEETEVRPGEPIRIPCRHTSHGRSSPRCLKAQACPVRFLS